MLQMNSQEQSLFVWHFKYQSVSFLVAFNILIIIGDSEKKDLAELEEHNKII